MSDIELVDVSLRDGNQSLWGATGVTTRMVAGAMPSLDRAGYRAIELLSSTVMAVAVRFHREDPWERIDLARRAAPSTPLGFLTSGRRFVTFYRTPDAVLRLAFELLARHGVRRMWVIDPMHDMDAAARTAQMAKDAGFEEVVGGLCYSISPVHTDAHYAEKAALLDAAPAVDSIYIKDPAGLLTPDRVKQLVPALRARTPRRPLDELHTHATTGLAPLTLLDAADAGITTLHCAVAPLADGTSHPDVLGLVANLEARGHRTSLDLDAVREASAYLTRQARIKRLPVGRPAAYDERYYRHGLPGGLRSTLARQLAELGRPEVLDAVVEESIQVRRDLGWTIVVTPFAQHIVTQATLNVLAGERYRQLADEIVDLLTGAFGPLPAPPDPELLDRALATARARRARPEPEEQTLADLRRLHGTRISDEELLLRAVMAPEQVDAMRAAAGTSPAATAKVLLDGLRDRTGPVSFSVTRGDTRVAVRGGTPT